MKHIGFILSEGDPFVIIDLDDPFSRKDKSRVSERDPDFNEYMAHAQRSSKIYHAFDSYAERSQSGKGIHIVMRGRIPCGARRGKVEVYSDGRYMIFTGDVLKARPVHDCQPLLDELFSQLDFRLVDEAGELVEEEPLKEDAAIWAMATRASNAAKFISLCRGEFEGMGFPSQSEADYSLLSMLTFYSRSNEQVRRMFRQTVLGQRDKALRNDKYLNSSLRRIRMKEPPLVDMSMLKLNPPVEESEQSEAPKELPENITSGYTFPVGLVGEVAKYILSSAIRPVPEIALAAAIALCAGVCGRSYNVSGTGLNQYVIVLARTGRGKEGAASGIDNLMAAVRQTIPMADTFLGPANFASGQALVRVLDKQPCFVSVLGEFGLMLQSICDVNANDALKTLKRVLLDIYAKSGHSKVLRSTAYSDSDKNTKIIQSPNVSILGESTPETFFNGLDSSHINEGLIPRFSIIEYKGLRPPANPNAFHQPHEMLVSTFGKFLTVAITTAQNNTVCPVREEASAAAVLSNFNTECDMWINNAALDIEVELWNRAHLKALKMAGLIAAGCDPHAPIITHEIATWSIAFVKKEINGIMERFTSGDVGTGEDKMENEVRRLYANFQKLTHKQRSTYRCPQGLLDAGVVTFQYLNLYSRRLACFKHDKRGAARALSDCLQLMVKTETLEMIPLGQLKTQYQTTSPIYYPGPAW